MPSPERYTDGSLAGDNYGYSPLAFKERSMTQEHMMQDGTCGVAEFQPEHVGFDGGFSPGSGQLQSRLPGGDVRA